MGLVLDPVKLVAAYFYRPERSFETQPFENLLSKIICLKGRK